MRQDSAVARMLDYAFEKFPSIHRISCVGRSVGWSVGSLTDERHAQRVADGPKRGVTARVEKGCARLVASLSALSFDRADVDCCVAVWPGGLRSRGALC